MLVICDFDGTVTTTDVTNVLWDRYGMEGWRRKLLRGYRAGETSHLELMDMGWRDVSQSEQELLDYARPLVAMRDGFAEFLAFCHSRGWPFRVISGGIDWYIRAFLPAGVEFVSYTAVLDRTWRVSLPQGFRLAEGVDFKVQALRDLRTRFPGVETMFIGDGRNDFPLAREADRVFAVRGSTLARLCAEHGVPHDTFESFTEIAVRVARAVDARVS
jgi:2-hydroxy-3-keto-5-methylthiopentenyl-1-phosphate phosphatase